MHCSSLNRRDISRAGAIFTLLYSNNSVSNALEICLEFLVALTLMRKDNDNETAFSIKSHEALTPKAHTVCGANVMGALSPISERSVI